jgi:hypothetical protein
MVAQGGGVVSYERETPVGRDTAGGDEAAAVAPELHEEGGRALLACLKSLGKGSGFGA